MLDKSTREKIIVLGVRDQIPYSETGNQNNGNEYQMPLYDFRFNGIIGQYSNTSKNGIDRYAIYWNGFEFCVDGEKMKSTFDDSEESKIFIECFKEEFDISIYTSSELEPEDGE